MDDVLAHGEGEVATDRARRRLDRVGRAGQGAERLDRSLPLHHERHQRARGDELHELAEERPLDVLGVMGLGRLAVERTKLGGNQSQPLRLESRDHLADQAAADAVGLDQDQGALGHSRAPSRDVFGP